MKKFILFIVLVVIAAAIAMRFAPQAVNVKETPLLLDSWSGPESQVNRAENHVLRSHDEWLRAWQKTGQSSAMQPLFKNQMGVALFAGERLTAGYLIRIIDITEDKYAVKILYQDLDPRQTRLTASPYATHPWTLAVLPANAKPVIFEKTGSVWWYRAVKTVTGLFRSIFVTGFNSAPSS